MAIKEEERQEFAETKVADTENVSSTDVNVRTGMTNDQFDLHQKREVDQQIEFKDELYAAVERGDIQRVKELTGWTRDATRPDNTVVTEVTKEAQENAHKKEQEEEAKRQKELNEQNAAATGAEGPQGPVDSLMAFMMDPFGLSKGGTEKVESYSGNSLEEAIRRGDWTAAARIMNANRAREQNEKQDFDGDGHVSGGNNHAMDGGYVNPTSYGWSPEFQDANGNFQPWAESADGDVKTINNINYDAQTGEIKLPDGSTYTDPNGQALPPQDGKEATITAGIFAASAAGINLETGAPPPGTTTDGKAPEIKPATADDITNAQSANKDARDQGTSVPDMTPAEVAQMQRFHGQFSAKLNALPAAERTKAWNAINGTDEKARADAYRLVFGKDAQGRYLYDEHRKTMDALKFDGELSAERQTTVKTAVASKYAPVPIPAVEPAEPVEGATPSDPKTDTTASTTPASTYSWAEDEWYYSGTDGQDGYGYMDDYGFYYEPDGRTYDEYGYTDKDGGYTWDTGELAGAYQDKNYNYVDKDGNLFLDGNYSDTPDALAKDAPEGGWAAELKRVAAVPDGPAFSLTKPDATQPATLQTVATQPNATQPATTQTVATQDVDPTRITTPTTPTVTAPASALVAGAASPTDTTPTNTGAGSLYEDQSPEAVMANFSLFLGSLTSFLSTSDVTRALNTFAPSSFIDFSEPVATAGTVWGTKFFDPANITAGGVGTAPAEPDPLADIAPTNPNYKPKAQASMSV